MCVFNGKRVHEPSLDCFIYGATYEVVYNGDTHQPNTTIHFTECINIWIVYRVCYICGIRQSELCATSEYTIRKIYDHRNDTRHNNIYWIRLLPSLYYFVIFIIMIIDRFIDVKFPVVFQSFVIHFASLQQTTLEMCTIIV